MYEQALEVDCTGMAHGTPPDPCVIVICGVAGDLSRTTLIPSLYALACQQLLPEPCAILGVGRRTWNDDALRQEMRPFVQDRKDFSPAAWDQFAKRLHFVSGDFSAPASEALLPCGHRSRRCSERTIFPITCSFIYPCRRLYTGKWSPSSARRCCSRVPAAGGGLLSKSRVGMMPRPHVRWIASCSRSSVRSSSTASITTWGKRRSRTCWSSASPTRALNPSGTTTILIMCKSPWRRPKALVFFLMIRRPP